MNTKEEENYWSNRYQNEMTGWDLGAPSTPLKTYIDQLENKNLKILIPGAGNAYEAAYLFENGFYNTHVLDISKIPLTAFAEKYPNFPPSQLLHENFFEHEGQYDLIMEQTFFCSFPPTKKSRTAYAEKMADLLKSNGKLVGLWFDFPLKADMVKRPFGGTKDEYLTYLSPYFEVMNFERCYNSMKTRNGVELFGIFKKLRK